MIDMADDKTTAASPEADDQTELITGVTQAESTELAWSHEGDDTEDFDELGLRLVDHLLRKRLVVTDADLEDNPGIRRGVSSD